jgi:AcrR family transcriptional regulator
MTAVSKARASFPSHIVGPAVKLGKRPPSTERILMAAESIFGERGYASVSVEDILNLADVSRATFYQHFGSKEELAAALFDRALEVLTKNVLERFAAERTLEGKIAAGLDVYLELWQRHGRLVQELSIEALRPGSKLAPARRRVVDSVVAVLCATALEETGEAVDPIACEHLILGTEAVLVHRCLETGLTKEARRELQTKLLPLILGKSGS